jgi:U2 small nuclear ribonucleoprotein A'
MIENLGTTEVCMSAALTPNSFQDQYDAIDFSDNDIIKFENFPLLPRLNTIFINNNKLSVLVSGLGPKLANLETLMLTNNKIANLGDLDALAEFKKLTALSLLKNPVIRHPQYRLYLVYKIPSLKWLDFQKVKRQV